MPRPGPRPYECVRRAWHSDRHQPMRGSLIQEIFRLANDVHSSATRKNKEWQQKLPFVVLKAEEILYSKANSEAEYVDVANLFERVNDAIDTIVRRDESESGDLLQPCIEAALNLGCIPRRASRSQRHNSPQCYLSSGIQESVENSNTSPCNPDGRNMPYHQVIPSSLPMHMVPTGSPQNNTHQFVTWYPSHSSPGVPVTANCGFIGTESLGISQDRREVPSVPSHKFRVPSLEISHSENEKFQNLNFPLEIPGGSTTAHVYPLHYAGNQNLRLLSTDHNAASRSSTLAANSFPDSHVSLRETNCLRQDSQPILRHMTHMLPLLPRNPSHIEQDKHLFSPDVYPRLSHSTFHPSHYVEDRGNIRNFTTSNCNTFVPSSSFDPCKWDDEKYQLHNFLGVNHGERTPLVSANTIGMHRGASDSGCDLSLRLGPPLLPCVGGGCVWSRGVEGICSSSSHVRTKFLEFDCSPSSLE